jgi:hypothetical protein
MQRRKGSAGERELAGQLRDLLGIDVRRRVRAHAGDSDLLGVAGFSVEVKRYARATRGQIAAWWGQTCDQAGADVPVLFFRLDRDQWRAVWPFAVSLGVPVEGQWLDYSLTVEGSLGAFAAAAREHLVSATKCGVSDAPFRPASSLIANSAASGCHSL